MLGKRAELCGGVVRRLRGSRGVCIDESHNRLRLGPADGGGDVAVGCGPNEGTKNLGSEVADVRRVIVDKVLQDGVDKLLERWNETPGMLIKKLCGNLMYEF